MKSRASANSRINNQRYLKYLIGIASLLAVRGCYLYLAIGILENLWYKGTGGYSIAFNFEKEVLAIVTFVMICLVFARVYSEEKLNFSQSVAVLLMLIYFIPLNCSFSLNNMSVVYYLVSTLYASLTLYLLCKSRSKEKSPSDALGALYSENAKTVNTICALVCIGLIVYKFSYNGFDFNLSLDSNDVYSNREEYAEYRSAISGSLFAYGLVTLLNLSGYIAPLYCYFSLKQKKYFGVILAIVAILSSFSLSSEKAGLFFLAILFAIVASEKMHFNISNPSLLFTFALMLLLTMAIVDMLFIQSNTLYLTIIRRMMYIPTWMGTMYYDFFTAHTPLFFSDSAFLLQMIVPSMYEEGALGLISQAYFVGSVPSPNAGMLAESIMQLGYVGVIVFPFIVAAILRWGGMLYEALGKGASLVVAAQTTILLTNLPVLRTDFVLSFILLAGLLKVVMANSRTNVEGKSRNAFRAQSRQ